VSGCKACEEITLTAGTAEAAGQNKTLGDLCELCG